MPIITECAIIVRPFSIILYMYNNFINTFIKYFLNISDKNNLKLPRYDVVYYVRI